MILWFCNSVPTKKQRKRNEKNLPVNQNKKIEVGAAVAMTITIRTMVTTMIITGVTIRNILLPRATTMMTPTIEKDSVITMISEDETETIIMIDAVGDLKAMTDDMMITIAMTISIGGVGAQVEIDEEIGAIDRHEAEVMRSLGSHHLDDTQRAIRANGAEVVHARGQFAVDPHPSSHPRKNAASKNQKRIRDEITKVYHCRRTINWIQEIKST